MCNPLVYYVFVYIFLVLCCCHQGTWICKCIYFGLRTLMQACCNHFSVHTVLLYKCYYLWCNGVCVSVNMCECVKSSLVWVFGPRPWESPKTVKVKSDSLHFRPLQHETPSHIPLMLHTAEVLVAMVISSPNSVPLHSTPFDEILPILACMCTDVL